ncbi:MAG: PaaI family thioesterase [Acidimicrobiales bacterium]|nr:PaaI family thioesterase [Acidimicrobiales bacterium]
MSAPDPRLALNAALRHLIDKTRRLQTAPDAAAEATALVAQASALLDAHTVATVESQAGLAPGMGGPATGMGRGPDRLTPEEFFPYSPVIGPLNPLAPPMAMTVNEDLSITGTVTLGAAYNGPPQSVHGGVIALLMDELLGCTAVVNDVGGFTGTLNIYYRVPTPIGKPLRVRARMGKRERRKTWIAGVIEDDDHLYVEAEGIFIRPRMADEG